MEVEHLVYLNVVVHFDVYVLIVRVGLVKCNGLLEVSAIFQVAQDILIFLYTLLVRFLQQTLDLLIVSRLKVYAILIEINVFDLVDEALNFEVFCTPFLRRDLIPHSFVSFYHGLPFLLLVLARHEGSV